MSQRYKRNIVIQITGILDSFISNRQNDFVKFVYKTNLDKEIIKDLLYLNKYNLIYSDTAIMLSYINKLTNQMHHRTISIVYTYVSSNSSIYYNMFIGQYINLYLRSLTCKCEIGIDYDNGTCLAKE